jgi:hypothetical protein
MSKLLTASLLVLSATASAHPQIAPRFWIEEAHTAGKAVDWEIQMFGNGAWTRHVVDGKGNVTTTNGQLADTQFKQLQDAIAKASWHVFYTAQACPAVKSYTTYAIDSREVWRTDTCNGLDDDSRKALATIDNVLASTATPVWLEHRHGDGKAPTLAYDVVVYPDGSFARHDSKGDSTGQLTGDQIKQLHAAVDKAPWQVKQADAACAAISSELDTYSVGGKEVWTQRMCQLEYLDDTSEAAIRTIDKLLR